MADSLLVGAVKNGEYTKTQASQDAAKANQTVSTSKTEEKRDTGYNKDMFLQLLVAEMQYQDPLQPSDNSEYVAQLASFTQVEAMQTLQENMETIQSNSIVGKIVALNINGQEITGKVDFVQKDDKKGMMLSIGGELYEMSKMISVVDTDYYNAKYLANLLTDAIKKLPEAAQVTVRDGEVIGEAASIYNAMDEYDRSFVDEKLLKKYNEVLAQYTKLMQADSEAEKAAKEEEPEEEEKVEAVEKTEDTVEQAEAVAEKSADTTIKTEETDSSSEETEELDVSDATEV